MSHRSVSLPTMIVTFSGARILEQVMDANLNLDQNKANWTVKVLTRKLVGELNFPKLEEKTCCICTIMYPLSFEPNCYIHLNKQTN